MTATAGADARQYAHAPLETDVARSRVELDAIRDELVALGGSNVTTDPDFFLALIESRETCERPHVVVVRRDGEAVAMLVARIDRVPVPCRVGYWSAWTPAIRAIAAVHDGFIGHVTEETTRAVLESLSASVACGEADGASIPAVRLDAPLAQLARQGRALRLVGSMRGRNHWGIALPETLDAYLATFTKGARKPLRRHANHLERDYAGRTELRSYRGLEDIEAVFRDLPRLAGRTYQSALAAGFEDTPFMRRVTALTMERGQFRAYVLYLAGEPVAYWHGYVFGGVLRTVTTGFDPAYADYRVGTYTLLALIADACTDPAVESIDFGIGDAEYKQRFGNVHWLDADLLLLGRRLRPRVVRSVRRTTDIVDRAARFTVERAGIGREVKRRWRQRMTTPAARS